MKIENRDVFLTKELAEYLQGFPEDTEVQIIVIDCHHERKYAFPISRLALITDEEEPMMFLDIDSKDPRDVTREEGEEDDDQ